MNEISRIITIITLCAGGLVFASPALAVNCDKNPNHHKCGVNEPPPPPPLPSDGGAACAESAGLFPAFAYKTTSVTGKRRKKVTTTEIFVANSVGDCSIKIFGTTVDVSDLDYVQRGDGVGRIVWTGSQDSFPTIQMLDFSVTDRVIDTDLPLTESIAYTMPISENVGLLSVILSDDGNRIVFSVEQSDGQGGWLDHINITEVENCSSNCPTSRIREFPNEGVGHLAINSSGNRIYFSSHDRIADVYRLAFIESQNGAWSAPTDIVTSEDSDYSNRSFREQDVGTWPLETETSSAGEIVAVHYEEMGVQTALKIFSVADCVVDPSRVVSCLSAGLIDEIGQIGFPAIPIFTSIPFGATAPPSLFLDTRTLMGIWNADLTYFNVEQIFGLPTSGPALAD